MVDMTYVSEELEKDERGEAQKDGLRWELFSHIGNFSKFNLSQNMS